MKSRKIIILLIDLSILILSFLFMVAYKPGSINYLSTKYLVGFGVLLFSWLSASYYFKKLSFKNKYTLVNVMNRILISNLAALSIVSVFIIAFSITGYSRLVFFGTVGIASFIEIFIGNFYFLLIHTKNRRTDILNPPPNNYDLKKVSKAVDYRDVSIDVTSISKAIYEECGQEALDFILKNADIQDPKVLTVSTTTRFNIEFQPDKYFTQFINLKKVNDIQYINKFFETINRKLPEGGLFCGCVETKNQRKSRILKKYPPVLNRVMYFFDFLIKRVFPKFILTKKIYFLLTRGNNRVLTKAEILGRLYSCGFKMVDEKEVDNYFYFVVEKIIEPAYDMNPTYGPFIKLKRIGKGGKIIKVYKLRTMHPYAEYLQPYIFAKNHLDSGGKFKNDFRVSTLGSFLRALWLDELPMFFNLMKGDLKLVGVRPLSKQYFDLYKTELKEMRVKAKPGLIPPFYADMPKTLDEIQDSEQQYLESYFNKPFITDFTYFWKAFVNIVFRKARSK